MTITRRRRAALLALTMTAAGAAQAAGKETLVYCSEATPTSLNPQQGTTAPDLVASSQTLFDRLVSHDLRSGRLLPSLATGWTVSADGKTYTFTLRRGVKFNSNKFFTPTRDFNADDVIFSVMRQKDAANPIHGISGGDYAYFRDSGFDRLIREVKKLDDYRIQFTLSEPNAAFLADWAMDFTSVLSAEYAQAMLARGTPAQIDTWPLGTGPYALQQFRPDAQIRYAANPHYWRGDVATKRLVFAITPDPETRLAKLRAGECQIIPSPRPSQLDAIRRDPQLRLEAYPSPNVGYLAFNTQKKPFSDPRVRQALNYATDKAAIVRAVFGGYGEAASGPIPRGIAGYDPALADYPYDVAKARALLAQAGVAPGTEVTLWALPVQRPYNPNGRRVAEIIQSDWAKVGVKAKIVTYEWGEYLAGIHRGEHDAALYGWMSDNGDPDNFVAPLLGCASIATGSNIARWCDSGFDRRIREAARLSSPAARVALYREAQQIFHQQAPWITLASGQAFYATRSSVSGFNRDRMGNDFSRARIN